MLPVMPAAAPRRGWRWFVRLAGVELVLGFVAAVAGFALAGWLTAHTVGRHADGWAALVPGAIAAAVFLGGYAAFVRGIEGRPPRELWSPGWARELAGGIAAGLGLFALVVGAIGLLGGYAVVGHRGAAVLLPAVGAAVASGVSEEVVFRGLFFRLVERGLGSVAALLLSAALFGAAHLANPNASMVAGAAIAVEAGVMLAALYVVTRRLWAAIGLHAAWNLAQGGVFGIAVSGFPVRGLLVARMAGPDWLTGGAFGAEASVPAVAIAGGLGAVLLWVAWARGQLVAPGWRRRG